MSGEEKVPLAAFLVRKRCPRCLAGKMEPDLDLISAAQFSSEEQDQEYAHRCTECDYLQQYTKVYPHFVWEELEIKAKN